MKLLFLRKIGIPKELQGLLMKTYTFFAKISEKRNAKRLLKI